MPSIEAKRMYNVFLLGICFLFLFTAFATASGIEALVLSSIKNFPGKAYYSQAIIYAVYSLANWISPAIINVTGPRVSMFMAALTYCLFVGSFIKPSEIFLYLSSALLGVGAAVLWTAQGSFLTLNSTKETMGRNSGIFWALFSSSMLFGNIFVYFQFSGQETISESTQFLVYVVLTISGLIGTLLFIALIKPPPLFENTLLVTNEIGIRDDTSGSAVKAFRNAALATRAALKLFLTRNLFLLALPFAYTGFVTAFYSAVYGTCVGNTKLFGKDSEKLTNICGILTGVGEITAGLLFSIFDKKTTNFGRDPIVLTGFLCHIAAYFIIFLNIPDLTPTTQVFTPSYINPNVYLAVFCSVLLGFGDGCFQTQIISILGSIYREDSVSAFALFRFVQSLATMAAFFYSQNLALKWHLIIMGVTGVLGFIGYSIVELSTKLEHIFEIIPQTDHHE